MENNIVIIEKNFNNEIKETVNARDLHKQLGNKRQFTDWIKQRIEQYDFIENIDFISLSQNCEKPNGGRPTKEYFISINMAKELCMIENNEQGRQIRKYFIECERIAKNATIIPQKIDSHFLQMITNQMAELENKIEEDKPKVEFYDTVLKSKDFVEMSEVAKCLNKNIGRNKLFNILKENGILRWNNEPYQTFVDKGFFKIETNCYTKNGQTKIYLKTVVSQKGVDFINKLLLNKNINIK